MAANDYTTSALLKATLTMTGQTFADADIDAAITAASLAVDGICNRRFWKDTNDTTRVYTPRSPYLCAIDDLATLTTVKTDSGDDGTYEVTLTVDTDFVMEPRNGPQDTPARPWTMIRVRAGSSACFPTGVGQSVQVVGKFGWPTVPAAVSDATTILATQLLKRKREMPFPIAVFNETALRLGRSDTQLALLLNPYTKLQAW